jgi:hypothetical protein
MAPLRHPRPLQSLEDGHLTLGKALTLPRVSGHPAGAETPRAESLVVHYDTTVDSVVSGSTVVDVSGNGINGTLTNGAAYSSTDRALLFDGVNDYIQSTTNLGSGNITVTISMWINSHAYPRWFMWLGADAGATGEALGMIRYENEYQLNVRNGNTFKVSAGALNTWEHLVFIYHGTGSSKSAGTMEGYVNGVLGTVTLSNLNDDQLNIGANPELEIGARTTAASDGYLDGSISNFKLYDVALTAEEVAADYALGRTGKSLNVTDTAVCIGGTVPRAQLDVRGSALFGGNVGIGTTSPTSLLHVNGTATLGNASKVTGSDTWQTGFDIHNTSSTAYWSFLLGGSGNATSAAGIAGLGIYRTVPGYNGFVMNINANGNVGIGVTNPSDNLHVNTTLRAGFNRIQTGSGGTSTGSANGVYVGTNMNGSNGGGAVQLTISTQTNAGGATGTWVYILRKYYNGAEDINPWTAMTNIFSSNGSAVTGFRVYTDSSGKLKFYGEGNTTFNYKWSVIELI